MANAFVKAQFMDPPGGPNSASPIGAVKAGQGIIIAADGTISTAASGGTVTDIVCSNGIQGGGQGPQVFLSLLAPAGTALGGVRTIAGSGISIDSDGIIRNVNNTSISSAVGLNVTDFGAGAFSIDLKPAGATAPLLGGVFIPSGSGLTVGPTGALAVGPATVTTLGGIKPGTGVTVSPDGTLSATGTGGTITGVGAGTGLGGGGVTGAVTLFLRPATTTTIGGVYPGENVTVDPDGRLNVSDAALGVISVAGTLPVVITGTPTNPIVGVNPATTAATGIVQLNSAINSTSEALAATSLAVKTVADIANAALPRAGGTMSGAITFTGGQTFPGTIPASSFTQTGGLLVGDTSPPGYAQLPVGSNGQVLVANSSAPLGIEWQTSLSNPTLQNVTANGATTNIATTFQGSVTFGEDNLTTRLDGRSISFYTTGTVDPLIKIDNQPGGSQAFLFGPDFFIQSPPGGTAVLLGNRVPAQGSLTLNGNTALNLELNETTKVVLDSTGFSVNTPFKASNLSYPTADGAAGAALVTNGSGTLSFSTGFLQKTGGTMTGDITFSGTQTFPGVLVNGSIGGSGAIVVGGTPSNPLISASTATTSALGVVQPDGTTITINGSGVISAAGSGSSLPLAGGTMTGNIVFNAGQTFPGTIASSLLDVTGDIVYASATNTPASLPIGAAGTILAVNSGLPAWRTSAQLGLLTSATAATTYAPLDSPAFTGPITVTSGGSSGSNAMTISGGNLVLATSFTPPSSASTGSVGELAWDNSGYLYFCYAPNTWGRVQIDLTPF
jgi:hypothetical protein